MTSDKASAAVAIIAALVVVIASNKQWWTVSYNGHLVTRLWATRMLVAIAGLLLIALVVLFVPDDAVWLVLIAGTLASIALGWWLGAGIHRRSIRRFKEANPGLGPLIGGDYD